MVSSRGRASADKRAITNSNRFSIMPANPRIYFDIETGPLPIAELVIPPFDPSQVKLGNIKNPDIIAEKIQRAEENHVSDYIKHAALERPAIRRSRSRTSIRIRSPNAGAGAPMRKG